jgi:hypothetical protein
MLSIRDCDAAKLWKQAEVIRRVREEMGIPPPSAPPTGGYGPLDGKRIIIHTPEEWAEIVEAARSGKHIDIPQPPVGVSPDLGRSEGVI